MTEEVIVIKNSTGLHARPAAIFVQTAGKFVSNIWIEKDEKKVNAKSIMGIMALAVSSGESVKISAEGEDEVMAVNELMELVTTGFED